MKSKYLTLNLFKIISILFLYPFVIYAQDIKGLFKEGTSQIKIGNYVNAINKLEECIKINPEDIGCSCNLSVAYVYQGNLNKAIEQIEKVVYKEPLPSRGILFFNLGSIYDRSDNEEEAKNSYDYSLYLLPYFSQAYANLGTLYYVNRDKKKGLEYIYKANSMDSVMPDIQPEAKEVEIYSYLTVSTIDKLAPPLLYLYQSPAWHLTLAINYMNLKEFDKSFSEIDKAIIALDKDSPLKTDKLAFAEVHLYRASIYLLENNPEKAFEETLEAFNINPRHIGAISSLGQLYYLKGDYDRALKYYKMGLDINPNFPGILTLKEALDKER